VSETGRDSGWSEQYAETGGWPPPADDQRSYGPGTPPGDPHQAGDPPAGQSGESAAPPHQPDGGADARPGRWGAQAGGYAQPGQTGDPTGGYGQPGPWSQQPDPATGQPGPWGQPAQPGQWGPASDQTRPADRTSQWAGTADQGETGPYGQPTESWAPGDSAYGRLGKRTPPPPPQQRPRRPWDGRPAPARRPGGTPVVTITLITICVVFYLVQQANPSFTARYALIPFSVEQGEYARLITSAFLHASLLHLGTNMITLYIVGAPLERVLRPIRYLIVYFLSALGGSLLSVWLSPEFSIGVGASGAIFGLFGALVVLRRQVGAEAGALAVLIGLNLVISFTLPNISWQAHIGGLITGTLVALAMQGIDRVSRRRPAT
jgi:membrane associated rhomboid family serine protease